MKSELKGIIVEVDITHRCNLACRHCNRLCNAEKLYGVTRSHIDMEKVHIDFLCQEIKRHQPGLVKMIRILGGEPLLSDIIDYAVLAFEELKEIGYIELINIVSNGTIQPSITAKPYVVYSPVCIGDANHEKGNVLTAEEVLKIKNIKHRNITICPRDFNEKATICNRVEVCGIHYSVFGFAYTAACFPAMYVSMNNHRRFMYHLPTNLSDFFDGAFNHDVCEICVSAINTYKSMTQENPDYNRWSYIGNSWKDIIAQNSLQFKEPDVSWIQNINKK